MILVPLTRIDEQHLSRRDLACLRAIVELEPSAGDYERDRYRVPMLRHGLAGLEAQANDPHRTAVRDLLETECTGTIARDRIRQRIKLNIVHATGIAGAQQARGTVVVIDVLRSFTVSAYALAGGARECRLVRTVHEARTLADQTPGAVLSAEEDAMPIEGIPISNSPTMVRDVDLKGRVLIQRSTAGTQVAAAVQARDMFAGSLVVARATVQACLLRNPDTLTLVASADHPEDHACASYMDAIARDVSPDLEKLLEPVRKTERYRRVKSGQWPGFPPSDLELALQADVFDFAMPVARADGYLRVIASF